MLSSSCEKKEASEDSLILKKTVNKGVNQSESDKLIFYLSKTLGVKESDIEFDSNHEKFIVLKKLEFPLYEISKQYSNANEFKLTNGIKN